MTAYVTPVNLSYVQPGTKIEFAEQPRSNSIRFHGGEDNLEVGRFEIVDGEMRFTGNCDETAKVMVALFVQQFNDRIEADKKAIREQALEEAADMCIHVAVSGAECWKEPREDCAEAIRGLK